jgi:hypothetical protein
MTLLLGLLDQKHGWLSEIDGMNLEVTAMGKSVIHIKLFYSV